MEYSNTWVNIDLDAIEANFHAIAHFAGTPVCAVVKADGYGHGAVEVARLLEGQCAFFGVASVAEALELKKAGIGTPILLLGHTPPELFSAVVEQEMRPAIFCWEDAKALSDEAVRQNKTAAFHVALDTGMSRIGFQPTPEAADCCKIIAGLPNLRIEGLFSHFSCADTDAEATEAQVRRFEDFDAMLRQRDICVPIRHMDNSAGLLRSGCHYDMVRAGIALYGVQPVEQAGACDLSLKPAMQWETTVSYVKLLPSGRAISYGGTYITDRSTMVATIPVGYADGYRRNLSGRFYVLIRGQRAPILGRVCMDQLMVDVTEIPGVQPGDRVVLMGTDGSETISAEALSAAADSFSYEQLCDISRRVTRVYRKNGQMCKSVSYLLK